METLLRLAEPWASLYSDSPPLQTAVLFVHLAGMLVGGGFALAADRATLRAARGDEAARRLHLEALAATHGPVLAGLAAMLASGVLMLAADLETYLGSAVFWTKMGLVVLLLANGGLLRRTGTALLDASPGSWGRLRAASLASMALWLAVVLAGTALVNLS